MVYTICCRISPPDVCDRCLSHLQRGLRATPLICDEDSDVALVVPSVAIPHRSTTIYLSNKADCEKNKHETYVRVHV